LWFDIGTPDQYFLAHKIWIDGLSEASLGATDPFDILTIHEKMQKSFQYFPAKSMEVSQKDIVGPSFLSGYVNVTPKCHIGPYTFVFGDSTLGQEYKIDRSILLGPPPKNDQSLSKVITHQDMTIHLNIPD
jgi:NDP-sugar pyrophosphorylase family protein